jgi:hypothetical protein
MQHQSLVLSMVEIWAANALGLCTGWVSGAARHRPGAGDMAAS